MTDTPATPPAALGTSPSPQCTQGGWRPAEPIGGRLARLSLEEKVALLSGQDAWSLPGLPAHGIPSLVMSDGPAGIRGSSFQSGTARSFPCETALAATWDPDVVAEIGRALGAEARRLGVHLLLGPTVNLHRHPLGGRNFECFSEDPLLSAAMVRSYVAGVESTGVACCVKHLVCNDSEVDRFTISVEIDEATLRQSYLVPFEAALQAGAAAVMAAYNRVNGTHASEDPWLLDEVLRREWGFDGVVVSDWYATHSTGPALVAGLDIEMPGPTHHRGPKLVDAVRTGEIPEDVVDRAVGRVLDLIDRCHGRGPADSTGDGGEALGPDRSVSALIRRAGARGIVLLKNEGVLPLDSGQLRRVALIGPGAATGEVQGGGSAFVNTGPEAGILPALSEALGPGVEVIVERGCVTADWPRPLSAPLVRTPDGRPGIAVRYVRSAEPGGPLLHEETAGRLHLVWIGRLVDHVSNRDILVQARAVLEPSETGVHRLAVSGSGKVRLSIDGRVLVERAWDSPGEGTFSRGGDAAPVELDLQAGKTYDLDIDFNPVPGTGVSDLTVAVVLPDPPDLMDRAVGAARSSDAVVLVAQSPPGWESEGHDRHDMTLPGPQDELIERVAAVSSKLVVVVNTGSPVSMPWVDRVPSILQLWFPGDQLGPALTDVLTGAVNPSGRLPTTFPRRRTDVASDPWYPGDEGVVRYGERSAFGYRSESSRSAALFPFGHGLSYSTFALGRPQVALTGTGPEACYEVTVAVTNAGGPRGTHVVQLYITGAGPDRPTLELKGFGRIELDPGASGVASIVVPVRDLRRWTDRGWVLPDGPIPVLIGSSSTDLPVEVLLPAPGGDLDQAEIVGSRSTEG